jgi:hypothetical protein
MISKQRVNSSTFDGQWILSSVVFSDDRDLVKVVEHKYIYSKYEALDEYILPENFSLSDFKVLPDDVRRLWCFRELDFLTPEHKSFDLLIFKDLNVTANRRICL